MAADESIAAQTPEDTTMTGPVEGKGKGKAVDPAPEAMEEDDSSEEEEQADEIEEPEDEDNMEEIDTNNIIEGGRRTRGKTIDFAAAAANANDLPDDEDDDEDFEVGDDAMEE